MLFQQVKSLLIMDSVKSHLENVIELLKRYNKEYKIIDGDVIPIHTMEKLLSETSLEIA